LNLLLDTHVWIWSHLDPDRLGRRARAMLRQPGNSLWLSPISVWEFLMLAERGRLELNKGMTATNWLEAAMSRAPMQDAPLSREVAIRSREVRLGHDDPADRFLAATADVYELTLVTADRKLLAGSGYSSFDAGS